MKIRDKDDELPKPFPRGSKLWFCYKHPITGKWLSTTTKCSVGKEVEATRFIAAFMKELASGVVPFVGPETVAAYAGTWLDKRTNASARDDRTRIEKHVLPRIGRMLLAEVKPRHIDDLVMALRGEGKLAPRTIRGIAGLLHTMFKRAVKEELIATNPVQMERGTLPKKVDKDPTWRPQAIYSRDEVERLISDPRILPDRHVLYGLKSVGGGMRHGEAARLRWRDYDTEAKPLGRIALGQTKSGVPREVPVHPTLAKLLAQWKLSGWEATFGRRPTTDDLIVPTRNMTERQPAEAQEALVHDLELLGLRVEAGQKRKRRGHDLRRSFITIARTDGAIDSWLRWITHGPSADMMDVYSTPPWEVLCREMAKVNIQLREGEEIVLSPEVLAECLQRQQSAKKRWKNKQTKATPTGFEPVLPA